MTRDKAYLYPENALQAAVFLGQRWEYVSLAGEWGDAGIPLNEHHLIDYATCIRISRAVVRDKCESGPKVDVLASRLTPWGENGPELQDHVMISLYALIITDGDIAEAERLVAWYSAEEKT